MSERASKAFRFCFSGRLGIKFSALFIYYCGIILLIEGKVIDLLSRRAVNIAFDSREVSAGLLYGLDIKLLGNLKSGFRESGGGYKYAFGVSIGMFHII